MEVSKNVEEFNISHAKFFKICFSMFEDDFLDIIKPFIVPLAKNINDKSAQRAATEVLSGLIAGMKHWPKERQTKSWEWIIPLLRQTFEDSSPEGTLYWDALIRFSQTKRDPRRSLPLLNMILNIQLDPHANSFFTDAKKIYFLRTILSLFHWRLAPIAPDIWQRLLPFLSNPFQQVRDLLGSCCNRLWQISSIPEACSLNELLKKCIHSPIVCQFPSIFDEFSCQLNEKLDLLKQENPVSGTSTAYLNFNKTCKLHLMTNLVST
jgi:proteasome activator subunit 4